MTLAEEIRELIEPIVADLGLDLFDLELASGQLRVTVDRPGGVDMQAVAAVTRAVSRALDEADPIAGRYTLEVSSPGLERVLRTPAHFGWAVGQQVAIKTVPTFEGERRVNGTISAADRAGVVLTAEAGAELRLSYDDIDKARTVFEWGGQPKPEAKTKKTTKTKKAKAS